MKRLAVGFLVIGLAVRCGMVGAGQVGAVKIADRPMMTEWGARVTPENAWREYPRPQMVRESWTCLNGLWDYVVTSNAGPRTVEVDRGKILVPFAFESPLSGVGRMIAPHEKMVYTRTVELHPKPGRRTLLNFEAVDWRAQVFVNGEEAMDVPHEGGNLPFSVDITPYVRDGGNELKVVAWDPTHTFINAGGKQNEKTYGCFYTRVSGIWQTVWMEDVPERYIRGFRVQTDIARGTVDFEFDKVDGAGEVEVTTDLPKDFVCWTPETPQLYHFTAKYGEDVVRGYFAMRKIDKARDAHGNWRFRLNDKFVFPIGTLDQGWWPDGLLTPPSLDACTHDLQTLKACGFDMIRKHIKVEPRLYYGLCDRLGVMVFQDAVSPAGYDNIFDETKSLQRYGMFRREWKEQIKHLFNHPSIVMWIPYNEGWGQPDAEYTRDTLRWTRRFDATRLVGGPSGWIDYDGGDGIDGKTLKIRRNAFPDESANPSADTVDCHQYPGPGQIALHKNRISMLGEFGGIGLRIPGHLWRESESWGYGGTGGVVNREQTQAHYIELLDKVALLARNGLACSVYTQTSDVEVEINGLMTYDRKVVKFDPAILRASHARVRIVAKHVANGSTPRRPGASRVEVRPATNGWATVVVEPRPCGQASIEDVVITPKGRIYADLAFAGLEASGSIVLPPGQAGEFVWQGVRTPLKPGMNELPVTNRKVPQAATPLTKQGLFNYWDPAPNWWAERHEEKIEELASYGGQIDIVMLGDSITHNWEGARGPGSAYGGRQLAAMRAKWSVVCLGYGGDTTRNVLWRLTHGELDGYRAKCFMLMIGTNNGDRRPEDTAAGVKAILDLIARKQPQAKTILLPIFPSGATADHPWRVAKNRINALLKDLADGERVIWHDFNVRFLNPDGTFPKGMMMDDNLHPLAPGYDIWAEEVTPLFQEICGHRP